MGVNIELTIDELVLHGVSAADSGVVERELRRELTRLLATAPPAQPHGTRDPRPRAVPPIDLPAAPRGARVLGHQIAHAIHGALRKS